MVHNILKKETALPEDTVDGEKRTHAINLIEDSMVSKYRIFRGVARILPDTTGTPPSQTSQKSCSSNYLWNILIAINLKRLNINLNQNIQ
ncbi:hypothetical protein J6590_081671 [Homalodisca vitripennis]|nr:hypothetical protein J6590_081671 [Homalodisca vitripennis]